MGAYFFLNICVFIFHYNCKIVIFIQIYSKLFCDHDYILFLKILERFHGNITIEKKNQTVKKKLKQNITNQFCWGKVVNKV